MLIENSCNLVSFNQFIPGQKRSRYCNAGPFAETEPANLTFFLKNQWICFFPSDRNGIEDRIPLSLIRNNAEIVRHIQLIF